MEHLFENWEETKAALTEGLNSDQAELVSGALENEKEYLSESASDGSVQAHDIAGYRRVLLPMTRRVMLGSIGTELVGVVSMKGPVDQVYTMRYTYAEDVEGTHANPFGLPANIAKGDEVFGGDLSPIRQWYTGGIGADVDAGASGLGSKGQAGTANIAAAGAHGLGWGSSLDSAADCLHGGSGSHLEGSGGRKMGMNIVGQTVEAKSRKLQAGISLEAMQDAKSGHNMNIETEMTKALSADIISEIDQEIITDLIALAGTAATFDGAGAGGYGSSAAGNYAPAYVGDRLANIGVIINDVANEIGRKNRRGAGNFIVVSPRMVGVLQSASRSTFAPAVSGSFKGPNNTMLVGTLNGNIKVYSYMYAHVAAGGNDTILVGYKGGNGQSDAGYYYCPYVPLMSSGIVTNPVTFNRAMSLMTRYGKLTFTDTTTSLGNSADYYGKINVTALDLA
jgi:hypothetical protein